MLFFLDDALMINSVEVRNASLLISSSGYDISRFLTVFKTFYYYYLLYIYLPLNIMSVLEKSERYQ